MPEGQLIRYQENIGTGHIETKSGRYQVAAGDVAPDARVEGAFVTFDTVRDEPFDRAINVRLREGTRNAPNQRRFGDNG